MKKLLLITLIAIGSVNAAPKAALTPRGKATRHRRFLEAAAQVLERTSEVAPNVKVGVGKAGYYLLRHPDLPGYMKQRAQLGTAGRLLLGGNPSAINTRNRELGATAAGVTKPRSNARRVRFAQSVDVKTAEVDTPHRQARVSEDYAALPEVDIDISRLNSRRALFATGLRHSNVVDRLPEASDESTETETE